MALVVYQGQFEPFASGVAKDSSGTIVPLVGALAFSMRFARSSVLAIDHASATILNPNAGLWQYAWQPGNTAIASSYEAWLTHTPTGGNPRDLPEFPIEIISHAPAVVYTGIVPVYATVQDFANYMADDLTAVPADAVAERLLRRAELEVDTLLAGFGAPYDDTGLKYAPSTDLTAPQFAALTRAVCAQAKYHLIMGDEFFDSWQYDSWQGPDFAAKGKLGYFSPRVALELAGQGIARSPGISSVVTSYLGSSQARLGLLTHLRAN